MSQHLKNTVMACLGINNEPHGYRVEGDPKDRLFPILSEAVEVSVELDNQEKATYHTALTRILRWARSNRFSVWSRNPDIQRWDIEGDGAELLSALADAGFEIDSDDHLVIHGERVEE